MKIEQLGLQCFTIRDHCKTEEDFAASMKKVADIGYQAVQVSAVGPIPPERIKEICDANGLTIINTHERNIQIIDNPQEVIERLKILGCVHTAYPNPHVDKDEAGFTGLAADLQKVSKVYKDAGITLSYHNHALEFQQMGARNGMEILFDEAPDLAFELDTFWVQKGGGSVEGWCRKCTGRLPAIHIKDYTIFGNDDVKMAAIGDGNLDWPAVIEAAEQSGCEWFIFEQDRDWAEDDPFVAAKRTFDYVSANLV